MSRLVTVFGATGAQGNPIARALVTKGFQVRAVTRNPDSDKAKALKSAGFEVVKGDLNDAVSVDAAVRGAYGVFYVTNYWELFGKNKDTAYDAEIAQGKLVADACKKAGVKHVVYSGLEVVKEIIGTPCLHFDAKGMVERYLDEIGVPNTSVRYSFYFENFLGILRPQKEEDGTNVLTLPMNGPMDGVSVEDAGPAVAAVFSKPEEFIGKKIGLSGDKLTMSEYMEIISKVTGNTWRYNQLTPEEFVKIVKFPSSEDMASMFDFYSRGNPDRDVALTHRLNPNTHTFAQWAPKHKEQLQAV